MKNPQKRRNRFNVPPKPRIPIDYRSLSEELREFQSSLMLCRNIEEVQLAIQ